jgi:biotin carboxylase
MASDATHNLDGDIDIDVQIDINTIASALVANPAFIDAVAKAVLVAMTKDARALGNLFGKWAQKQPANPATRQRL